jgi:hypothetical protein
VSRERAILHGVFETLRLSLALAIQHGLTAVLVFCGGALLTAFLMRDVQAGS